MKKQAAALTVTALTLGGLGLVSVPAQAEEIDGAITSLTTAGEAVAGEPFTVNAEWSVPDYSQPGDTFTLQLPEQLVALTRAFEVKSDDGQTVANVTVENGLVTATLTDYVTQHPINIKGTLSFSARAANNVATTEPETIEWQGQAIVVQPRQNLIKPVQEPRKSGWNRAGGDVGWAFDIPGQMTNAELVDSPNNVALKCDSIYVGIADQSNGYPSSWTPLGEDAYSFSCTEGGFTLNIAEIPDNQLVHVTIDSVPVNGVAEATNDWTLTADNGSYEGAASTPVYWASGNGNGELPPAPSEEPTPPAPTEEPTPEVTETPEAPEPSEEPTPEVTETPEAPEPSEEPTPEVTETPEAPEPSEEPTPEVTETPEAPQPSEEPTPEVTETPEASETPEAPQPSEEPTPEVTESPEASETPAPVSDNGSEPPAQNEQPSQPLDQQDRSTVVAEGRGSGMTEQQAGRQSTGVLAYTGFNAWQLALGGLGILALGVAVVAVARRRAE